jgi:hypothetical protein
MKSRAGAEPGRERVSVAHPKDRLDCAHLSACRRLATWPERWGFKASWGGCREGCGLFQKNRGEE